MDSLNSVHFEATPWRLLGAHRSNLGGNSLLSVKPRRVSPFTKSASFGCSFPSNSLSFNSSAAPPPHALQQCERFSEDFLMIPKKIATLLILSAVATVSADLASAQGAGFNGGGGGSLHSRNSHGGGFHGRGSHGRGSHGRGFVGYGFVDGYGYDGNSGFPDWYGISSGYDECPLFRQRVMTRDGWRVRMVPIC